MPREISGFTTQLKSSATLRIIHYWVGKILGNEKALRVWNELYLDLADYWLSESVVTRAMTNLATGFDSIEFPEDI